MESNIIFTVVNVLIFIVIIISIFNPMGRLWIKRSNEILDNKFRSNVKKLAKNMEIGEVEMGILPWKKLKIANALQTGSMRKVYVFIPDYLYENLTPEENLAVIAHEFAHIKLRHILKIQIFVFSVILCMVYSYFLPSMFIANHSTAMLIQVIGIWSGILSFFFLTVIRRRFEKQADLLAARYISPKYLISALNKLSDLNFMPKEVSKAWGLDHPSISKRIEYLKRIRI